MKSMFRYAGVVAVCGLLMLPLGGCKRKGGGGPEWPAMSVKTMPAETRTVPIVLDTFGNTKDHQSVNVIPQVSGTLLKAFITDGAVVTNGQPLFLIDPSDYETRVSQAEGAVSADEANLQLSRLTLERNQPLVEKGMISTENFDTLKTQVQAAQAQLQADKAALAKAYLDLTRCTITSSLAGVCSKINLDPGNLVMAGQTLLTNIRSYDPMDVDFSVSEQYLPLIREALAKGPVKIEVLPRGDTNVYEGTLVFIDNAVDLQTGTVALRGQVPNPEMKLWAQQFADIHIIAGQVEGAVMVPESAIQIGKQGPYLYVATSEGKAELRPIRTGVRFQNLIQIAEGVAPGDMVIVMGQLMLYPGAAVADLSRMPPPGAGAPAGAEAAGEEQGGAAK
jgi:multidrug efflux system membrane fusion protein